MLDTYKQSVVRALRQKYGIQFSKNFGQNLLTDANIIDKIVSAAEIDAADTVVEIGPGFGALTAALLKQAGKVIAVEIDRRMIPVLEEVLADAENLELICADFLKYDLGELPAGFKLMGNLPYNITTPIIAKVLERDVKPARMVFMMQKEVAERLCAPPGSRTYGAISVLVQYHAEAFIAASVSREVFIPKPQVDSSVVVLSPYAEKPVSPRDERLFFALVKAGFGQRRKMLRNALGTLVPRDRLDAVFAAAGIAPETRAESLSVADFATLADTMLSMGIDGNEQGQKARQKC